jgi:hypothetical protein
VPPDVAERLIVFGFFEDAIDRLSFGAGAEQRLRAAVTRKFDARRCCHPDDRGNRGQEKPPNA